MTRPQYAAYTFEAIPFPTPPATLYSGEVTGATFCLADGVTALDNVNPVVGHSGFLADAQIIVQQEAGGSLGPAKHYDFYVETSISPTGPWVPLKLVTAIRMDTSATTTFHSAIVGPLGPYVRAIAAVSDGPSARFRVWIVAGG